MWPHVISCLDFVLKASRWCSKRLLQKCNWHPCWQWQLPATQSCNFLIQQTERVLWQHWRKWESLRIYDMVIFTFSIQLRMFPLELESSCYHTLPFSLPSSFIGTVSKSVCSQKDIPSVRIRKKNGHDYTPGHISFLLLHFFLLTSLGSLLLPHKIWQWCHYCS